jgi:hypothetical protein
MTDPLRVTRRWLLSASLLGGAAVLVSACGDSSAKNAPSTGLGAAAPAPGGALNAPAVVPPAGAGQPLAADPLAAVAVGATPVPTVALPQSTVVVPATATPAPAAPTVAPSATSTAPPAATATPIPYDATRLKDILGESITSYAGSVPPRVHNVQLATRLINGAKVAPGATFSFDDTVGDQTQAHGFQVAWGIVNNDGTPETVQADAGGICQVATTLFQAAYWAGLPFVRRYHHLYWIAHYGEPPYGAVGLDATVDFPPVDLRFKNTTSDWILVDAQYDSTHVHIRLRGVSPDWVVTAGKPQISNLVKVDRTLIKRDDPTMAPGTQLMVEAAQDGFDVTLERLVKTKSGDLVDRYVFTNHYEPAHNVMVVGTKGITPTPSTSPTPVVTPTAVPSTPTPVPSPASFRQADGRIQVPSLVGMPEGPARQLITNVGLQNTFTNYQGPGDVPAAALNQVSVGAVLSQQPPPGTLVSAGTTVYIAVRKS